ncbi:MAG TPA: ion transporter [Bacteroidales bacterium]|nr:ion transporter [Bacteroidales bacterium]
MCHENSTFVQQSSKPMMKQLIRKIFLNEHIILCVILINAAIIFAQESGVNSLALSIADLVCTLIFIIEMVVKQVEYGVKGYWRDGWNRLDGVLVLLSLPSVVAFFMPAGILGNLSVLLVLRLLRVLRFFRIIHIFPNFSNIARNFGKAMRDSYGVFAGFIVLILIVALVSCALFRDSAPEYFATPIDSIYSIFRICTGEGWNEIPDTIAEGSSIVTARWVRLYFSLLLVICSIIGLSLVNSIFVDAMVSDNNDDLEKQVKELNDKIDQLLSQQKNPQSEK